MTTMETTSDTGSTTDVMGDAGDLFGVTADGNALTAGKYAARIHKVERKTNDKGGKRLSVEFKIANGPSEGKTVYFPFGGLSLGGPVNPDRIAELMADGMSMDEASAKAAEGMAKAKEIGLQQAKKLAKAAGYIDLNDKSTTAADKQKIVDGTAWELTPNFKWTDIEGRIVMVTLKEGKPNPKTGKSFMEVVKVESADNVGDVGSACPI